MTRKRRKNKAARRPRSVIRHVLRDDAGAKSARRAICDLAIEDQFNLLRASKIEVLTDYVLEEQAAVGRSIEHLSQGEFGLEDRDIVAVTGVAIGPGEGVREEAQPLAQQGVDLVSGQTIADLL